jgi:hypothetical protein
VTTFTARDSREFSIMQVDDVPFLGSVHKFFAVPLPAAALPPPSWLLH